MRLGKQSQVGCKVCIRACVRFAIMASVQPRSSPWKPSDESVFPGLAAADQPPRPERQTRPVCGWDWLRASGSADRRVRVFRNLNNLAV